jgi:Tol biopolymer transport system component
VDAKRAKLRAWVSLALAAGGLALALPAAAQATFPGGNGRIAYTWSRGGEGFETPPHPRLVGVVSVRPDGGGRRLVARRGTEPSYSPSGRRIAFLRSNRLWVARADGKRARPVTPRGWPTANYEWSPHGTRLAFVRDFEHTPGGALYSVEPDGSGLRRLLKAPQGLGLRPGAWSPDGKAIVYQQYRITSRSLVRVHRAGGITTLARLGSMPTWSRRGLIAYARPVAQSNLSEVCAMRPDPGAPVRCVGFADADVSDPTWSPDGRRLMLSYTPQALGPAEIWTVRPDGTVLTRAPRDNFFPIFSPDGRWLTFSLARFGGVPRLGYGDLYLMRPDGTDRRRLVRGGQAAGPDWQPLPRR